MTLVAPKRKPRSHRKRVGVHQHKHKDFGKAYWPYLPMVLLVLMGFGLNALWPSQKSTLGYATSMSTSSLLSYTNQQRSANGKASLTLNSKLNTAAQNKAQDMADDDYWSHNSPDGKTPWTFITATGYDYKTAGENLAYGFSTASATITGWMNSPPHRENLLSSSYTEVGFGYLNIPNYVGDGPETLVVAMYASPVSNSSSSSGSSSSGSSSSSSEPVKTSTLVQTEPVTSEGAPTSTESSSEPTKKETTKKKKKTTTKEDTTTATPVPTAKVPAAAEAPTEKISRFQLVANQEAAWSVMVVLVILTVSFAIVLVKHGVAWHKLLIRGEKFVIKHPLLDLCIVAGITIAVVLSSTAGLIK